MNYPRPYWSAQATISASLDNAQPAIAVGNDESVYYACATKSAAYPTYYNITVGKLNSSGIVQWQQVFPQLVTPTNSIQPSIVVGLSGEVFLAFVTSGSTAGRLNMSNIPNFCLCPIQCSNSTFKDIVLARIDQTTPTSASLTWYIQDASINSFVDETVPKLALDSTNHLLYLAWQSTLNIQCYPSTGSPNILLACFDVRGNQLWLENMCNINGAGANINPVITTNPTGAVTVAWTTNATVTGDADVLGILPCGGQSGAPIPPGQQQVEAVSFQTDVGNPTNHTKLWILSAISNIFVQDGNAYVPSITSASNGTIYLAFLTNGTVVGGERTDSAYDVVTVSLQRNGVLRWMNQGLLYNNGPTAYTSTDAVFITTDTWGNPYVSLLTNNKSNVILFRLNYLNGRNQWIYDEPTGIRFTAYGYALTDAQFGVFPTSANAFSASPIAIYDKYFYVATSVAPPIAVPGGTHQSAGNDLVITNLVQQLYAASQTPFDYISNNTIICRCNCTC